jgi:hypothetical protein
MEQELQRKIDYNNEETVWLGQENLRLIELGKTVNQERAKAQREMRQTSEAMKVLEEKKEQLSEAGKQKRKTGRKDDTTQLFQGTDLGYHGSEQNDQIPEELANQLDNHWGDIVTSGLDYLLHPDMKVSTQSKIRSTWSNHNTAATLAMEGVRSIRNNLQVTYYRTSRVEVLFSTIEDLVRTAQGMTQGTEYNPSDAVLEQILETMSKLIQIKQTLEALPPKSKKWETTTARHGRARDTHNWEE